MSLHHEESDRVFPTLYLPIMEECHRRVLARWREYNPLDPAWWRHRAKTRKLDSYICKLIRDRWDELDAQERCALNAPPPADTRYLAISPPQHECAPVRIVAHHALKSLLRAAIFGGLPPITLSVGLEGSGRNASY